MIHIANESLCDGSEPLHRRSGFFGFFRMTEETQIDAMSFDLFDVGSTKPDTLLFGNLVQEVNFSSKTPQSMISASMMSGSFISSISISEP
jgi:hypothetical protein